MRGIFYEIDFLSEGINLIDMLSSEFNSSDSKNFLSDSILQRWY